MLGALCQTGSDDKQMSSQQWTVLEDEFNSLSHPDGRFQSGMPPQEALLSGGHEAARKQTQTEEDAEEAGMRTSVSVNPWGFLDLPTGAVNSAASMQALEPMPECSPTGSPTTARQLASQTQRSFLPQSSRLLAHDEEKIPQELAPPGLVSPEHTTQAVPAPPPCVSPLQQDQQFVATGARFFSLPHAPVLPQRLLPPQSYDPVQSQQSYANCAFSSSRQQDHRRQQQQQHQHLQQQQLLSSRFLAPATACQSAQIFFHQLPDHLSSKGISPSASSVPPHVNGVAPQRLVHSRPFHQPHAQSGSAPSTTRQQHTQQHLLFTKHHVLPWAGACPPVVVTPEMEQWPTQFAAPIEATSPSSLTSPQICGLVPKASVSHLPGTLANSSPATCGDDSSRGSGSHANCSCEGMGSSVEFGLMGSGDGVLGFGVRTGNSLDVQDGQAANSRIGGGNGGTGGNGGYVGAERCPQDQGVQGYDASFHAGITPCCGLRGSCSCDGIGTGAHFGGGRSHSRMAQRHNAVAMRCMPDGMAGAPSSVPTQGMLLAQAELGQMLGQWGPPDRVTSNNEVKRMQAQQQWRESRQLMGLMGRAGVPADVGRYNALILWYKKNKQWGEALAVLQVATTE